MAAAAHPTGRRGGGPADDPRAAGLVAWFTAQGGDPGALPPLAAAVVVRYLDAMLAENAAVNLTAIRDPQAALVLHAMDSLALGLCAMRRPRAAADVGSGNGFPGIATHALFDDIALRWIERTAKKAEAMTRALDLAGVEGVTVCRVDAMQVAALRPDLKWAHDLVTARAVADPEAVARLALPLLGAKHGNLVLWLDEDLEAPPMLAGTRLRLVEDRGYTLPEPAPRRRHLARYKLA